MLGQFLKGSSDTSETCKWITRSVFFTRILVQWHLQLVRRECIVKNQFYGHSSILQHRGACTIDSESIIDYRP